MRNKILFITVLIAIQATIGLGQAGFEQYYYLQEKKAMVFVPIVHFKNKNNWYAEVRYNYEEQNSFSAYGGKTFSKARKLLTYSLTPMMGMVIGKFRGASVGLNATLEYKDFFLSSQSQFTDSYNNRYSDFFFGWSEVGYQPLPWFYFGCSFQQTFYTNPKRNLMEPGVMLGFTLGRWTFPVYSFSLLNADRYFVVGINHAMGAIKTDR